MTAHEKSVLDAAKSTTLIASMAALIADGVYHRGDDYSEIAYASAGLAKMLDRLSNDLHSIAEHIAKAAH